MDGIGDPAGEGAARSVGGGAAAHGFRVPSLDGLRGLSFLIVFLSHAGLGKWMPASLGLGVFFVLSGYLITTLLRMEFERTGTIGLSQFYARRMLRIFPGFYLILAVASALTYLHVIGGSVSGRGLAAQACHLSNYYIIGHGWWSDRAPGTWVYWSLAVEEHFYLVFPLCYLLMRRAGWSPRQQVFGLAAVCAIVLCWRYVLVYVLLAAKDRVYVATDTRVDSILCGCILAICGNPALDARSSERGGQRFWLAAGIALLAASLLVRDHRFEQTLRYMLQGLGLLPIFVWAILHPAGTVGRLLNSRMMCLLGTLSYTLYLVHTTALYAVHERLHLHAAPGGLVALGLSLLVALAVHRWVERPCGELRKRLTRAVAPRESVAAGNAAVPAARVPGQGSCLVASVTE